ncbi:MAG: sugar phosphate isomerase/epimerase [Planctomycetes bacterium]|nr:sugar phosphate isomerase/epimerase [Planctomycetota bacterium]
MGVQSYCFRKFSFEEALQKAQELDLKYIEAFPGHFKSGSSPEEIETMKAKLKSMGITLDAYGVCGFSKDHERNKRLFDFAKSMGIPNLSANPTADAFDSLEKLVEEYKINIAIHNHGPKSRYSTDEDIQKVVEGRSNRIGLCIDTGHFMRSDVNPVDVVRKFAPRVHGVHLKDTKNKKDCIVGTGDLDLVGFLQALKDTGFKGSFSLEYESDPKNPIPAMRECLANIRAGIQNLR